MTDNFKNICDCHCHSEWSFDGCETTDDICCRAIQKGISVIAITDHCEANGWRNPQESEFGDFSVRIPQSVAHMKESQQKYQGRLTLLRGLELGQPLQDLECAEIALQLDDFDFVLGSVHNIRNTRDFYWLNYTQTSAEKLLYAYFNEVLEVAVWNKFDSLSHLTYPLRYITGREKIDIAITDYLSVIDEIFNTLIRNGKALEVNTSGLRQELGRTMPDEYLLRRYKNLGGELITIGSDAHTLKDIGSGIPESLHMLKQIGFEHYFYFEKHQPVAVALN